MAGVAEQLQVAVWITAACVRVAEGCLELAGSRAVYESSSPQRSALRRVERGCGSSSGGELDCRPFRHRTPEVAGSSPFFARPFGSDMGARENALRRLFSPSG
jgi:hypothetical protein